MIFWVTSVPSPKSLGLRCVKNGPSARREEGASSTIFTLAGRDLNRRSIKMVLDVTDEQRSRRPIFNATLRAAASWLFFRPAAAGLARPVPLHFLRQPRNRRVQARAKNGAGWALRSRLEKQPTDPATAGRSPRDLGDGTLGLQHPIKLDDLCAWNEKIIWCITHIPGKRSK